MIFFYSSGMFRKFLRIPEVVGPAEGPTKRAGRLTANPCASPPKIQAEEPGGHEGRHHGGAQRKII